MRKKLTKFDKTCLMPIDEFKECQAMFTPDDGFGYWATETECDDECDVFRNAPPEWATHVVWYNR